MTLTGRHISYWLDSTLPSSYPALAQDVAVDVAVVGAGLAGVVTAKLLKQANRKYGVQSASLEKTCEKSSLIFSDGGG
ncbi:MAG: FAD-dependent monooxygenase, partial [Cyanobacteria bacterium J06638_6]